MRRQSGKLQELQHRRFAKTDAGRREEENVTDEIRAGVSCQIRRIAASRLTEHASDEELEGGAVHEPCDDIPDQGIDDGPGREGCLHRTAHHARCHRSKPWDDDWREEQRRAAGRQRDDHEPLHLWRQALEQQATATHERDHEARDDVDERAQERRPGRRERRDVKLARHRTHGADLPDLARDITGEIRHAPHACCAPEWKLLAPAGEHGTPGGHEHRMRQEKDGT